MASAATAAVLGTFHYSIAARHGVVSMHNASGSAFGNSRFSTPTKRAGMLVSCVKTSEASVTNKSNGLLEKSTPRGATFPSGCEELVAGVCDETQIAELKIKIGDFEMHLKRNINSAEAPVLVASPTEAPPIPSKPMSDSAPAAAPSSTVKAKENPFVNDSVKKSRKLAALEASGATGYVLVSCPTVGSFRIARTLKGKKQPPACKEGDVIKEGKTICYLDQFGTELPVKSDVDGEVIKILFDDGEAVGYGDPLIAVLPSFHDIIAV